MRNGVVSIGYQGRTIEQFVEAVLGSGASVVADVRLNAISRRAGFSKNRLSDALETAGISYVHFKCLGNPKSNREPFWTGRLEEGRAVFRDLLREAEPAAALAELRSLAATQVVAVLCFEGDESQCHRQVVIDELGDHITHHSVAAAVEAPAPR